MPMVLIIDDDFSIAASLALLLKQAGFASHTAAAPAAALQKIAQEKFDLILQDMNFSRSTSGEEGLALLRELKQRQPQVPVILITAWGSIGLAVRGMQAGAADFITKPWSNEQLLQSVQTALALSAAGAGGTLAREDLEARYDFNGLIGRAPNFLRVLEIIGRVSATEAAVLLTGESGTGKELLAEALHRNSSRAQGPFVKVNLGGISPALFESEMFGHVKGAFTDARYDRKGRFELADGGTIFLDEIGDLEPSAQVKLLRVLQDRTFEPLGSSHSRRVEVRVISATNRNLAEMVSRGEFREDLLYRLNLIAVHVPPLRERPGDIALLAHHFLEALGKVYRRPQLRLSADAEAWLAAQPWPGNVRQLRQVIERTVLMHGPDTLSAADFRSALEMQPAAAEKESLPAVGSMTLEEMEKAMIAKTLQHHGGNISRAAEALGLSRAALYRRCEKFGIPL